MPPEPRTRVLIVDHEPDILEALRLLFEGWGCEVDVAEDAAHALKLALERHPAVAFVDIGLPGVDGYEVARGIRAAGEHVYLVAFTGWDGDDEKERASAAGFNSYLVKPADPEKLHEVLARVRGNESE